MYVKIQITSEPQLWVFFLEYLKNELVDEG